MLAAKRGYLLLHHLGHLHQLGGILRTLNRPRRRECGEDVAEWLGVLMQVERGQASAKHNAVVGSGLVSFASSGRTRTAAVSASSRRTSTAAIAQNVEPQPQGYNAQVLLSAALRRILGAFLVGQLGWSGDVWM